MKKNQKWDDAEWTDAIKGAKKSEQQKPSELPKITAPGPYSKPTDTYTGKTDIWAGHAQSYGSASTTTYVNTCSHDGTVTVWDGPRGIRLHGARAAQAESVETDLLIDLSGTVDDEPGNRLSGDKELVKALSQYTKRARLLQIHWPDYSAPSTLHEPFWRALWAAIPDNSHVTICCLGSHGRTGTALASMVIVDSAYRLGTALSGYEATSLVRKRHCKKAVESHAQEKYLSKLAADVAVTAKLMTKSESIKMIERSMRAFDEDFKVKSLAEKARGGQTTLDLGPAKSAAPIKPLDPVSGPDLFATKVEGEDTFLIGADGLAPSGRPPLSLDFVASIQWDLSLAAQGVIEGDVYVDEDGDEQIAFTFVDDNGEETLDFVGVDDLTDEDMKWIEEMRRQAADDRKSMMLPGWVDPNAKDEQ